MESLKESDEYLNVATKVTELWPHPVCFLSGAQEESALTQAGPSKPALLICHAHLTSALASTRASVTRQDWRRYTELYESFGYTGSDGKSHGTAAFKPGQRVTLA